MKLSSYLHAMDTLSLGKTPGVYLIWGFGDLKHGVDILEKIKDLLLLLVFEPRLYQLYQLGYSGSSARMDIVTNAGFHFSKKHLEHHLNSHQLSKEVLVPWYFMCVWVCVCVCVRARVCDKRTLFALFSTKTYHCMTVNQRQQDNANRIFSVLISAVIAVQLTRWRNSIYR